MRKRTLLFTLGGAVVLLLAATPILLAPGAAAPQQPAATAIAADEQARAIAALRPPKRERPAIAIVAWNRATEVSDFLSTYGVLARADVADITVVAEKATPIQLYPSPLTVEPQATMAAFDARYPDGADYVIVPAMDPGTDTVVAGWIRAQYEKGASIVSVCNGSRMLATTGLLDDRRATGHWSAIAELQEKHPSMQWVPDRRYVTDGGVTTSTGITASIPTMLALVEAIGGRERATEIAGDLGVTDWDARHRSAAFELTLEHKKTFIRNTLAFWRHETVGVPIADGVDEVALGLLLDAYTRTALGTAVTVGATTVETSHGLRLHPNRPTAAGTNSMLPSPPTAAPATLLETELPRLAARYDNQTAAIVALVMEYPWTP